MTLRPLPRSALVVGAVALGLLGLSAPVQAHSWDTAKVATWSDSVVRLVAGPAVCTGVVVDDQGTVATAYHCVATRHRVQVQTHAGQSVRAQLVATSPQDDLALLRAPELAGAAVKGLSEGPSEGLSEGLSPRPLRTTDLAPGLALLAIGHPFGGAPSGASAYEGTLSWSVSQGVLSAVGTHLLQTDAALNPGTSGGPVFDAEGAIVGLVSRKLGGEGVSFLVPAARVAALLDQPTGAHRVGGDYGFGLALPAPILAGGARSLGVRLELNLRDRLVAGFGLALPLDARVQALAWGQATYQSLDLSLAGRQRLGDGPWSTTVDLGVGAWQLVDVSSESQVETGTATGDTQPVSVWTVQHPRRLAPGLTGRLGMHAAGLRLTWLPELGGVQGPGQLIFSAEVDWPGVVGTL